EVRLFIHFLFILFFKVVGRICKPLQKNKKKKLKRRWPWQSVANSWRWPLNPAADGGSDGDDDGDGDGETG
ncbi:hypothetical protein B0F90DRAFT_1722074, partial [Multifurca ochricompacta]